MKSIKMDFVRDGDDSAILEKGRTYHVIIESSEHRKFKMPLRHEDFLTVLMQLRYQKGITQRTRKAALRKLSKAVTRILELKEEPKEALQLDVVTNARELWALPFEAALAANGEPLLAQPHPAVVLTRRAPKAFAERQLQWPSRPRVLFAYASPKWSGGQAVDALSHRDALLKALKPWVAPEREDEVLTVCREASLADIELACRRAEQEGKPYTHVHLLAHGVKVGAEAFDFRARFGIALRSDDFMPTMAEDLVSVLWPERAPDWNGQELPAVVTLAICDAANAVNTIIGAGGLAQELHSAGVPIVIASQLPITFAGAETMTRVFYEGWMAGKDVRTVLHETRVALHEDEESGHDWVSLVAYVRLPEGYKDYLLEIRLKSQLAALETASKYADRLLEQGVKDTSQYEDAAERLLERVRQLEQLLREHGGATYKQKKEIVQENAGLLGSAYKRLAELFDHRAQAEPERDAHWRAESRQAMTKAHDAYLNGFRHNTSHHWTGVQYLALDAILNGEISNIADWYACYASATAQRDQPDSTEEDRIWALGSIAELGLLASLLSIRGAIAEDAIVTLKLFCERVGGCPKIFPDRFPVHSTRRQMLRYVDWWTKTNGFFGKCQRDLVDEARQLAELLKIGAATQTFEDGWYSIEESLASPAGET
jgi:hypothetical protein